MHYRPMIYHLPRVLNLIFKYNMGLSRRKDNKSFTVYLDIATIIPRHSQYLPCYFPPFISVQHLQLFLLPPFYQQSIPHPPPIAPSPTPSFS